MQIVITQAHLDAAITARNAGADPCESCIVFQAANSHFDRPIRCAIGSIYTPDTYTGLGKYNPTIEFLYDKSKSRPTAMLELQAMLPYTLEIYPVIPFKSHA